MFREMRRNKQMLSLEECIDILNKGTSGVLAVTGDDGYPYTVPLSYVYYESKIYFHCAKTGHKIDGIKRDNKVSFCVVAQDHVMPEEYTTYYRSVVVFGKARIVENGDESKELAEILTAKYLPEEPKEKRDKYIEDSDGRFYIVEITAEHMTGKEAIELVNKKAGR